MKKIEFKMPKLKKPEMKKPNFNFDKEGFMRTATGIFEKCKAPSDKNTLIRLAVGAVLFIMSCLPFVSEGWSLALRIVILVVCGYDMLLEAVASVLSAEILVPKVLCLISLIVVICLGQLGDAALFVLIYRGFDMLNRRAIERSRQIVDETLDLRSREVRLLSSEDKIEIVPIEQVRVGDLYMVSPGDRIPLDGFVVSGSGELDLEPLTGETAVRKVTKDSAVLSGCVNATGNLGIRVTADYKNSIAARRTDYVEKYDYFRHKVMADVDKFIKIFSPAACIVALLIGIVPPLIIGGFPVWLYKAAVLLAVASPLPVFASGAITYYSAVGYAARKGILIRNKDVMDELTAIQRVVFDKNGALSTGRYSIQDVESERLSPKEVIDIAAYACCNSNSSEARTVLLNAKNKPDKGRISNFYEDAGVCCITRLQGGMIVSVGNSDMLAKLGIEAQPEPVGYTYLYVCIGQECIGRIVMSDRFKGDVPRTIRGLRKLGIEKLGMISADKPETGAELAKELRIDEAYRARNESEKAAVLDKIKETMENGGLAYVNNGYEDMKALKNADLGIALNGLISEEAMKNSNVLLVKNETSRVSAAIKLADNVKKTIKTNLIIMTVVMALVAILAVFGAAGLWMAGLGTGIAGLATALNASKYDNTPVNKKQ